MKTLIKLTFVLAILSILSPAHSQTEEKAPRTVSELPKVFLIGEYESMYIDLYDAYPGILLSESANDMDKAFEKWLYIVYSMEEHAQKIDYDLKGLKLWLHLFFDQYGKIDYLMFHKKPVSKNIDDKELSAFFRSFIRDFRLPVEARQKFNHSGSASFPTYGPSPLEAFRDSEK